VVRIGGLVVIREVAAVASAGRGREVGARVALRAEYGGMRSKERESRNPIVVELGRCPGSRVVALRAVGGKTSRQMIGVGGALQIRLVAVDACGWCSRKSSAYVARGAGQGGMRSRQRKMRNRRMVEFCAQPGVHGMTDQAIQRKAPLLVRRVLRCQKLIAVAVHAFGAHPHEDAVGRAPVAAFAGNRGVRSQQWKTVGMLAGGHDLRGRCPTPYRVALLAVIAHLSAVQVRVAGSAIVRRLSKNGVDVTSLACHIDMHSAQRVSGLRVMIELRMRPDWFPRGRRMARLTRDRKWTVRVARSPRRLCANDWNENGRKP